MNNREHEPTPNKNRARILATAGALVIAGVVGNAISDKDSSPATTSAPEAQGTTPGNDSAETIPETELNPEEEKAKQIVGDEMNRIFKEAFEGRVQADSITRDSEELNNESGDNLYTAEIAVGKRIVIMRMTAQGEDLSPEFDTAKIIEIQVIKPGKGTVNSDNPEGNLYESLVRWSEPYINGQEGRGDLFTVLNGKDMFSTQADIVSSKIPVTSGGIEAIQAAVDAVDATAKLLNL